MNFNDEHRENVNNIPAKYPQRPALPFLNSENTIAIFTTLSILLKMKNQLGLEAMIEYMEFYLLTIEKHNPRFKGAVEQALSLMSVSKIYSSMRACGSNHPNNVEEQDGDERKQV